MKTRGSVLIIDDEPGLREMLAYELAQEGFEVEAAENGPSGVDRLKRRKFDLAITDLKMPGMDGVATLEALRKVDPDIEVIVATGYATVETAVASLKQGAYDYIQKPYDLNDLKALLKRALEKRHLQEVVALYEASRALLATLNPANLVTLILDLARAVLHSDDVGLVLGDPVARVATVHRSGLGAAESTYRTLAARAAAQGPLRVASDDPERHEGVGSALAYPLSARDHQLGALVLLRTQPFPPFSLTELQRGTVFAGQLALALDNARLHEELGRKVEELLRTREQLVHAEKLSLAGELAGAVAHELNNPLAAVQLNLRSLGDYACRVEQLWRTSKVAAEYLQGLPDRKAQEVSARLLREGEACDRAVRDIGDVVKEVHEGVRRIADLVGGFTRLGSVEPQPTRGKANVGRVMEECLTALFPQSSNVACALPPGLVVAVSTEDLRTALLNVLAFLRRPERAAVAEPSWLWISARSDNGVTHIRIADEGLKLSPEEMRRLFDPRIEVQATTSRTMRLNIALALAYRLLHRSGGQLLVQKEGAGTAFDVVVPTAA
jgi:DNA-binding response OmpR family regulator/signal transduction histidine kinase